MSATRKSPEAATWAPDDGDTLLLDMLLAGVRFEDRVWTLDDWKLMVHPEARAIPAAPSGLTAVPKAWVWVRLDALAGSTLFVLPAAIVNPAPEPLP